MNKENIEFAIEVMKQAEINNTLCMSHYQGKMGEDDVPIVEHIEELHPCGNTACFIGHLALTKKFKEFEFSLDGTVDYEGWLFDEEDGVDNLNNSETLSEFLGIDCSLVERLIFGVVYFYGVKFSDVKPQHVIDKLNLILSGELE